MSEICYSCFQEKPESGACPHCGYDGAEQAKKYPLALKQGAILNGRYTIGRVLGQGGFGITYLAQDYKTKERIAIKEFLPTEFVDRTQGTYAVQVYSGDRKENFEYGKTQFLAEAKTLAQVRGNEHIVRVDRYFEENGTAYFAMEYVDGPSLARYMKDHGGKLSPEKACQLLLPVMDAMDWVHKKGIVHRDIAPDNILIGQDGKAKILDFGAARYSTGEKSKSLDVILKHGFAPKEQYQRHGRQGPFTDVYAMAATFYYAITGKIPPDAIDRMEDDALIPPSTLGVKLSDRAEEVLCKALEVNASDRYQSMGQFAAALKVAVGSNAEPTAAVIPDKAKSQNVEPVSNTAGILSVPDAVDAVPGSKPSGLSSSEPETFKVGVGKKKAPQNKKFIIGVVAAVLLLMAGLGATAERILQNRKTSSPQPAQEAVQTPESGEEAIAESSADTDAYDVSAGSEWFRAFQDSNCTPVALGDWQVVAVKTDGTVVAVGENDSYCDVSGWSDIVSVSSGMYHTAGLKSDGTVIAIGQQIAFDDNGKAYHPDINETNLNSYTVRYSVSDWTDIVAIDSGGDDIAGLKSDGTVVSTNEYDMKKSADWIDIISIARGSQLIGLKSDGTVVSTYYESAKEFPELASWSDITKIAAYEDCVLGLKADGTVVAVNTADEADVTEWTDIVDIATARYQSVGLKSDGTVVFTGMDLKDGFEDKPMSEVISGWTDIKAVYAGEIAIVGLKANGTIVSAGFPKDNLIVITDNGFEDSGYHFSDTLQWTGIRVPTSSPAQFLGQQITPVTFDPGTEISFESAEADSTPKSAEFQALQEANAKTIAAGWTVAAAIRADGTVAVISNPDVTWTSYDSVAEWTDIVSIDAGNDHLFGLKSDGTVVFAGSPTYKEDWCDTSGWRDVVAIACGPDCAFGVKADGTVLVTADPTAYYVINTDMCDVSGWKDIKAIANTDLATIGVKADGSVIVAGEVDSYSLTSLDGWTDIVAVAGDAYYLIGLHADGTVSVGNRRSLLDISGTAVGITAAAGTIPNTVMAVNETIVLKSDGTVDHVVGYVADGYDYESPYDILRSWTDIVAVDACASARGYILGLKSDGTVIVAKNYESDIDEDAVASLTNIRIPKL